MAGEEKSIEKPVRPETVSDVEIDANKNLIDKDVDREAGDLESKIDNVKGPKDHLLIPRWIVYLQAALLGIVATTFFIFGLMVGSLTSIQDSSGAKTCTVSGIVSYAKDGREFADRGAVVMLLPSSAEVTERQQATLIHPTTFEPLGNPAIDLIHGLGGAIVRANATGSIEVFVDSPAQYDLIIVSNNAQRSGKLELSKSQMAGIGKFFFPVEDLIGKRKFLMKKISVKKDKIDLGEIVFAD